MHKHRNDGQSKIVDSYIKMDPKPLKCFPCVCILKLMFYAHALHVWVWPREHVNIMTFPDLLKSAI